MRRRSHRLGFLIADRTPSKHSAFQHLTSLVWIILKATLLVSRFGVCLLFLDLWEYGQRVSTSCAWEVSVSCWLVLCLWTDTIFQIIRWYFLFPVVFWCPVFEQMGWFDLESTETRRVLEGMCVKDHWAEVENAEKEQVGLCVDWPVLLLLQLSSLSGMW